MTYISLGDIDVVIKTLKRIADALETIAEEMQK